MLELLMDLDATDEQLDSPVVYCSGREGIATLDYHQKGTDLTPSSTPSWNTSRPRKGTKPLPSRC